MHKGSRRTRNSEMETSDSAEAIREHRLGLLNYMEFEASDRGVGSIQLHKLNEAANLRDRIRGEIEEWARLRAEAMFAQWVLDRRKAGNDSESRIQDSEA